MQLNGLLRLEGLFSEAKMKRREKARVKVKGRGNAGLEVLKWKKSRHRGEGSLCDTRSAGERSKG